MRLLLDTHVLLWALSEPETLTDVERDAIADGWNLSLASAASLWEASIKQAKGKLKLPAPAADWLPSELARARIATLDIAGKHALTAGALPAYHGDPFDRMLVAQAMAENLTLVTRDPAIMRYGVTVLGAR